MQASHRVDVVAVLVCREISGRRAQHMLLRRNGCLVAPTVDYLQGKENTTAGVDSTPAVLVARPTSSSWTTEVGEIDEARAAPVQQERDAVPEATGATGPISGEGLVPIGLQHFAHRVGAGRQTREAIVPRGVRRYPARDRTAELDAPAREAGPRRGVRVHLPVDGNRSTTGRSAAARPCRGRRRLRRRRRRPRVRYGIGALVDGFPRA